HGVFRLMTPKRHRGARVSRVNVQLWILLSKMWITFGDCGQVENRTGISRGKAWGELGTIRIVARGLAQVWRWWHSTTLKLPVGFPQLWVTKFRAWESAFPGLSTLSPPLRLRRISLHLLTC